MFETISVIVGLILGAVALWEVPRAFWQMVGGWPGLRYNPWVWRPLVGSVVSFAIVLGAAKFVDHAKAAGDTGITRVVAGWVVMSAFCLAFICGGWALIAGIRRTKRIEQLLHFHDDIEVPAEVEAAGLSDVEGKAVLRLISEKRVTPQDLEELWPLLPPSGGLPQLEWVTREWVRERLVVERL
jgi:hypothetical protein